MIGRYLYFKKFCDIIDAINAQTLLEICFGLHFLSLLKRKVKK